MSNYESEDQQIAALKTWWNENGKAVLVGIVLGFSAIFGGRMWFDYMENQRIAASAEYDQLQADLATNQTEAVISRGEFLIKNFADTPYAALAALSLAKVKVEAGELASALSKLQWVLDNASQPDFVHAARLRMARVLAADGQYQRAIDLLHGVEMESYVSAYEEIKGDIFVLLEQPEQARAAYQAALSEENNANDTRLLQMKLDDLGA